MTREAWIQACAAAFAAAGYSEYSARDHAITEFNIRCRDEPLDCAPELPADRWPAPAEAATDAIREYGAMAY